MAENDNFGLARALVVLARDRRASQRGKAAACLLSFLERRVRCELSNGRGLRVTVPRAEREDVVADVLAQVLRDADDLLRRVLCGHADASHSAETSETTAPLERTERRAQFRRALLCAPSTWASRAPDEGHARVADGVLATYFTVTLANRAGRRYRREQREVSLSERTSDVAQSSQRGPFTTEEWPHEATLNTDALIEEVLDVAESQLKRTRVDYREQRRAAIMELVALYRREITFEEILERTVADLQKDSLSCDAPSALRRTARNRILKRHSRARRYLCKENARPAGRDPAAVVRVAATIRHLLFRCQRFD